LSGFDIAQREMDLLNLKKDVLEHESNDAVKKIYRTKINEVLAILRMLQATKDGDDRKFSRYADFIYGKPDASDVNYVVRHAQELIAKNSNSDNAEKRASAIKLQAIFGDNVVGEDDGVDKSILPKGQDIHGTVE
jgi:hypothetical protein